MAKCLWEFSIIDLDPSDLDEIVSIENCSFKSPWPKEIFEMQFQSKRSYNLVCKDAVGKLIGYCLSWLIYDEVHILKIAVDKNYRKNGIGTNLINQTLDYYRTKGASHAILEVRTDNYSAISVYESIGFEPLRIRKNYYSDTGEDALVMLLDMQV